MAFADKNYFKQMALTPKKQLKRLLIGTLGSLFFMLVLLLTSDESASWLFYLLSLSLALSIIYAIPGYIGIWLWRMRKFLFNID